MPVFRLNAQLIFPPAHLADPDGLLAVGGDLSPERLLLAYQSGIFPWYNEGEPIQWYSPDPRFVLHPGQLHISHSMKSVLRKNVFEYRFNTAFPEVIRHCKQTPRAGQAGTWITRNMETAYLNMHTLGHAVSAECWHQDRLVGGLYGIMLPGLFCGESMFSLEPNAGKFAFINFVRQVEAHCPLIDCQVYTPHLESLGARFITREQFLSYLQPKQ